MSRSESPARKDNVHLTLEVNGERSQVSLPAYKTLLEVLREELGLTGTKHGCELGECGACAVLIDDEPALACLVLALECEGRRILTVEGFGTMTFKNGKYSLKKKPVDYPTTITVTSSLGGSALANVVIK